MPPHLALRLDNLNRLPSSVKRVAQSACAANRSVRDLERAQTHFKNATDEQKELLLPVWYTNLDPTLIPNPQHFDTPDPSTDAEGCIARAILSLETLYMTTFPTSVGPDLWPRVWKWVQFLYMYRDHLPTGHPLGEDELSVELLMFAGTFFDHEETFAIILSTPGVFFMVAKAWPHVPKVKDPDKREIAFSDLRTFITHKAVARPANRAAIIEGAGGTMGHVANLIVMHIEAVAPAPGSAIEFMPVYLSRGVLEFVELMEPGLSDRESFCKPLGPLGTALASRNFVPILTELLCALGASTSDQDLALHAITIGFSVVATILVATPSNIRWIADALKHKLLRALIICALRTQMGLFIEVILTAMLPPFLVYPGVLTALDISLGNVEDLVHSDTFKLSNMYTRWQTFTEVAQERIKILKLHDAPGTSSMRACDNLQCGAIQIKSAFQRCAGCLSLYYCSQACQANDWLQGGHRQACKFYGNMSLCGGSNAGRTPRERSFLRALLDYDYRKSKVHTFMQRAALMSADMDTDRGGGSLMTLYDYALGPVEIKILIVGGEHPTKLLGPEWKGIVSPEWKDIVSRAARSKGRMEFDVIRFNAEGGPDCRVIPLRRNKSTVHDDLQALADEFSANQVWDTDLFAQRIVGLVESHNEDVDLLEIH
ncbi:hypothetical protein DFH06DRAFT_1481832 [Mycena polygramma]|nr:hypothetical protein DFH06DRAFT_1481832 [Mycena polygramma]